MKVTPIYLPTQSGKVKRRYLAEGWVGKVYFSGTGHTHAYAIYKAFNQFMRPAGF